MQETNKPEISVIMPVYNGEKFLREAIKSILNQTFQDFEFIIINDGSIDATEYIIHSFNDPRIVYIENDINLGLIKTLNKALKLTIGKFIARMDADDISHPSRFQEQIDVFRSSDAIDIVNTNAYVLQEDGRFFREQKSSITVGFEAMLYLIPLQNLICHPAAMVKSDLLKKYKYTEDISKEHIEDFDLWNRMLEDGCVCHSISECLLFYRNNTRSINHTQKNIQLERMLIISKSFLHRRFNLQMNADSLKALIEENESVDYSALCQINKDISDYFLLIKNKYALSSASLYEMETWKKQKILLLSLKSLGKKKLAKKIGIILFLMEHLSWFNNTGVKNFLKRIMYPNNRKMNIHYD